MSRREKLARASIYLGADQQEELRSLSERTGISMAFVIRRGIDAALEMYRPRTPGIEPGSEASLADLSAGHPAAKANRPNQHNEKDRED